MKIILKKYHTEQAPSDINNTYSPLEISYDLSFYYIGGDIPIFVGHHLVAKLFQSASMICISTGVNTHPLMESNSFTNPENALTIVTKELLQEGGYLNILPDSIGRPHFVRLMMGNILLGVAGRTAKGSVRFCGQFGSVHDFPEFSSIASACDWLRNRLYANNLTTNTLLANNPFYLANYTGVKPDQLNKVEYIIEEGNHKHLPANQISDKERQSIFNHGNLIS